jgi:uncharacterized membrane protein YhaH (DUF805 family)
MSLFLGRFLRYLLQPCPTTLCLHVTTIPAGWYPDPSDPLIERLWDGSEWVEKTRPRAPQAVEPAGDIIPSTPTYVQAIQPERSTFGAAVSEGFSKFANFDGRSSVSAYWNFWLFSVAASIGSLLLGPLAAIVVLALILPSLSFAVRRLHDRGKSGAYLLLNFLPIIGTLLVFLELASSGDSDQNQYGPPPGTTTTATYTAGVSSTSSPTQQTPGRGPAGGVILYDTGIPGDPTRYLEVAPAGWNRAPVDPLWTWDKAVEFFRKDQTAGWRLPTAQEAEWFRSRGKMIPGLVKNLYWTGKAIGTEKATAVDLRRTTSAPLPTKSKQHALHVRPVRSLNSEGHPSRLPQQAPAGRTLSQQLEPPTTW